MSHLNTKPLLHSEQFFGETRDFWWNMDFIHLMGDRLKFNHVQSLLDVGCGVGHWGKVLATALSQDAIITGVDREEGWITQAQLAAKKKNLSHRFRYQVGDALALPFTDNAFDMVTCQTVLIHLPDARAGLKEMMRVLKPGGLLLVAEPSNAANATVTNSLTVHFPMDELMERIRFKLTIERGKEKLGLGNNSAGDLIPGYLAEMSVSDLSVYLSDKTSAVFPPYQSDEQKAATTQTFDWERQGFWAWPIEETRRYFLAGGGAGSDFDRLRDLTFRHEIQAEANAIRNGTYHSAGGGITYLISARKPIPRKEDGMNK